MAPVWLSDTGFYFKLTLYVISVLSPYDGNPQPGVVKVRLGKHIGTAWGTFSDNTLPSPAVKNYYSRKWHLGLIIVVAKIKISSGISEFVFMKSPDLICIIADSSICIALFETWYL